MPPEVRIGGCEEPRLLDDATLLAQRILEVPCRVLLVDETERNELARNIGQVLRAVRDAFPAVDEIHARPRSASGQVIVHFEPALWEAVANATGESADGRVKLDTGHLEFDALNASLGLNALEPYPRFQSALLCFDDRLDVRQAALEYQRLTGVEAAEPNSLLGDGPDIQLLRSDDQWIVAIEDAHGDCPSGCIYRETHVFAVSGGQVEQLAPDHLDQVFHDLESSSDPWLEDLSHCDAGLDPPGN